MNARYPLINVGQAMEQSEVQALADKLDKLIERCEKLEQDNALLRELQDDWNRERAQLMHKNDLAKNKIEAMIGRLRALEHH
ncbi:TIGR02449 family protein [Marinobacter nauticus]